MSIINREGLARDIYLAIEHFQNIEKAREYIMEEFKNEYTEAELNATFDEVAKSFEGNDLKGWETMSDTLICEICGAEVDNWLDDLDEHLAEHDSNYMSYKEENEDTDAYILGFFASKG